MVATALPILLVKQRNLEVPMHGLLLGIGVGLLFATGSFLLTLALSRMPFGLTTALSLSYLLIVTALSVVFLHEPVNRH